MARKKRADVFTDDDDVLLAELGVDTEVKQAQTYTAKQERMIAGFEDIQRFFRQHLRLPSHGEGRDIFERLYAVRLDRIRANNECMELLKMFDTDGLLTDRAECAKEPNGEYELDGDEALLDALGVAQTNDISQMKHVRSTAARHAERNAAEEIAQRKPCEDFADFQLDFEAVQADLESGRQTTELFKTSHRTQIAKGDWFILDGQKAFVAEVGQWFTPEHGERDRRLRVIFDNGTESDLLLRSLRRALNKDEKSRRIVLPQPELEDDFSDAGPLFSNKSDSGDCASGTIYVARSLSDHPFVQEQRDVLHKIGVTGGDPLKRIAGAKKDPTFLLAEAELVASYRLANINRSSLESLLHKFLARARMDIALADRFGAHVEPREWFLVPLTVIEEVVERIQDGSISRYIFDIKSATLQLRTKPR
jgi:hypothetical protein